MADIEKQKKNLANAFYVNPEGYNGEETANDSLGVSFPTDRYEEGIEIPDKFITVKGDINYHLIDAPNIDWDGVSIPWAKRINKWGGSGWTTDENGEPVLVNRADMYAPTYKYNKPEGSWTTGLVNESEEIADILNYLIYRVISLDYFMDHFDERNLSSPVLRLTNYRTDWYTMIENFDPDLLDGNDNSSIDAIKDNLVSVNENEDLIVVLYPDLVEESWGRNDDGAPIAIFANVNDTPIPGVLVSDLGWADVRNLMFTGSDPYGIKEGNFDIYRITTHSTSREISFTPETVGGQNHMIKGFLNTDAVITETNGTELTFQFTLPVVAYKCFNGAKYNKASNDILFDIFDKNAEGAFTADAAYGSISATQDITSIDTDIASTGFSLHINRSNDTPGYASQDIQYKLNIYKGENAITEFKLEGKSNPTQGTRAKFYNMKRQEISLPKYTTYVTLPKKNEDIDDNPDLFKSRIVFSSTYGPEYDKNVANIKKSHILPYLYIKPDAEIPHDELVGIYTNCLDMDRYEELHVNYNGDMLKKYTANEPLILFDNYNDNVNGIHYNYGRITYEYDPVTNTFDFWYTAPSSKDVAKNTIGEVDENGNLNVNMYLFMYYPYGDKDINRLLKPVFTVLPLQLRPILKNQILFFDGKAKKGDNTLPFQYMFINPVDANTGETFYVDDDDPATFNYAVFDKPFTSATKTNQSVIHYSPTLFTHGNSTIRVKSRSLSMDNDGVITSKYADEINVELKGYVLPNKTTRTRYDGAQINTDVYTNLNNYVDNELARVLRNNANDVFSDFEMEYEITKNIIDITEHSQAIYDIDKGKYIIDGKEYDVDIDEDGNIKLDADGNPIPYYMSKAPKINIIEDNSNINLSSIIGDDLYSVKDIANIKLQNGDVSDAKALNVDSVDIKNCAAVSNGIITIKSSTSMFPTNNGFMSEGTTSDSYIWNADTDCFWLAFEITCPKNYNNPNGVMYDECNGWYFVKVRRGTYKNGNNTNFSLSFNEELINNERRYINDDIYVDKLISDTTKASLNELSGIKKWTLPISKINSSEYIEIGNNEWLPKENINVFNVGDKWEYRTVRDVKMSTTSTDVPLFIDNQNGNGLLTDTNKNIPGVARGAVDLAPENIAFDGLPNISNGALLNVSSLECYDSSNASMRPTLGNSVNIPIDIWIGNDARYNMCTSQSSIEIKKIPYDFIALRYDGDVLNRYDDGKIEIVLDDKVGPIIHSSVNSNLGTNAFSLYPVSNILNDYDDSDASHADEKIYDTNDIFNLSDSITKGIIGDISVDYPSGNGQAAALINCNNGVSLSYGATDPLFLIVISGYDKGYMLNTNLLFIFINEKSTYYQNLSSGESISTKVSLNFKPNSIFTSTTLYTLQLKFTKQ